MKPKDTVSIILNKGTTECNSAPPSTVLKDEFNRLKKYGIKITEEQVPHLAMKTLLTAEEVRMCIEHLTLVHERRKSGAKKAAETRRKESWLVQYQI